jgi:hypothetical protein
MLRRLLAGCLTVLLTIAVVSCDRLNPNADLPLEMALLRQAQFGQAQLVGQLHFDREPLLHIRHIRVQSRRDLLIQDLPSYDVRGVYDLELEFPRRTLTRKRQPFALYLQPQAEGTTWRLAKLDDTLDPPQWRTYLLSGRDYDALDFTGNEDDRLKSAQEAT